MKRILGGAAMKPILAWCTALIPLLASSLALALTSAPQEVPPPPGTTMPPGTIACDIGPPYTGQIPAGAVRAGYTHCAVNMDFTQFTNANQFLNCLGAGSPLLYFDTTNSQQAPCDSSHFSIVSDGGSNSFQLSLLGSEFPTRQSNSLYSFVKAGSGSGQPYTGWTMPEGYYVEQVWRQVSNPTYGGRSGYPLVYSPFFYIPAGPGPCNGGGGWVEVDFDELYSNPSPTTASNGPFIDSDCSTWPTGSGYTVAGGGYTIQSNSGGSLNPSSPPNVTTYNTFGTRLSADGSTAMSACFYLDAGVVSGSQNAASQFGCFPTTGLPSQVASDNVWTSRVALIFGSMGANDTYAQGWTSMSGNDVVDVKRMTIWTCANWRDNNQTLNQGSLSNECYPGSFTGTP